MPINRRSFLKKVSALSIATAIPTLAKAAADPPPRKSRKLIVEQLKKQAQTGYPFNVYLHDDSRLNRVMLQWSQWPTNGFALWAPEAFTFGDIKNLRINDPVNWKSDGPDLYIEPADIFYGGYSIQWQARVSPQKDSVNLQFSVTNTGQKPLLPRFTIHNCFNFLHAPDFMDSTGDFTYFRTQGRWQSMKPLRRTQAKTYAHDPHGFPLEEYCKNKPVTPDPNRPRCADSPLVVREGHTRECCVGYAWDKSRSVTLNFNRLHCIHSVPALGPLPPGKSVTRNGKLYFHKGPKDDLLKLVTAGI